MVSCLHIVGLGPGGLDQMTVGNFNLLQKARKIFLRTSAHPCVQELAEKGLLMESFDNYYHSACSFEEVYAKIVNRLEQELALETDIVYAVPGHPFVAEKTAALIYAQLSRQYRIIIHPALSFLDGIFAAVPFDPVEGLLVKNYDELKNAGISGREWLIIPQVYNKMIASEVKLDLMEIYPDDAEIMVAQSLGTGEQNLQRVLLYELDHQQFDHLSTVVIPPQQGVVSLLQLQEIMRILRSPEGCPWDREQTHESLIPYLIEESYEVIEAIENKDMDNLCEELGDLLLQVIFHIQVASEAATFRLEDVLQGLITKLIRRHPHVFGSGKAANASEVRKTWEQIKQEEKNDSPLQAKSCLIATTGLPALSLADRIQRQAAKLGFDWPDRQGPWRKVLEELQELEQALDRQEGIREELGDLLFSVVNLARFLQCDAEDVLRETVQKFRKRFGRMQELIAESGFQIEELSLEKMDKFWDIAKTEEKRGKVVTIRP
ncbi:MAG TPA: nucleoside triphosphate pyrophosphohydrolase [Desulfitobacteriaceae bacterium]|nr:nucleoside triphosphate pyrophosphohydrolase [Desulfitobacteriaceae bacterium]